MGNWYKNTIKCKNNNKCVLWGIMFCYALYHDIFALLPGSQKVTEGAQLTKSDSNNSAKPQ